MAKKTTPKEDQPAFPLPKGLLLSMEGRVATVTLARPERLNALTIPMYEGLRDLFEWFKTVHSIRTIILTGKGPGFCSGGDVEDIIGHLLKMSPPELLKFTTLTCQVIKNMRQCPQPIVAALNGTVAGAGSALAVACDVRVAVPEARISFLFVKAGLSSADMAASFFLPRLIGLGRATELLYTGDFTDAKTAAQWGLYNRVVPKARLMKEAMEMANRIAAGPSEGIRVSKQAVEVQLSMTLEQALEHDARVQAVLMQHPDFEEAYNAFKGKRAPKFM